MGTGTRRPRPDTIKITKSIGGSAPPEVLETCPDVVVEATAYEMPQLGASCSLTMRKGELQLVLGRGVGRIVSMRPDKRHVLRCMTRGATYVGKVIEVRSKQFDCALSPQ